MSIAATCIDSGGHNTQAVYSYCRRHRGLGVFAIKGQGGEGLPIIGNPMRRRSGKKTKRPTDVYMVGTDSARLTVLRRLRINEPGPGYCHFPEGRTLDYFRQLTVLKAVTKYTKGFPKLEWKKQEGVRAEAFDVRVYAFAALVLMSPMFDKLAFRLKNRIAEARNLPQRPKAESDERPLFRSEPSSRVSSPSNASDAEQAAPEKPAQDPPEEKADSGRKRRKAGRRRGGFVNSWK